MKKHMKLCGIIASMALLLSACTGGEDPLAQYTDTIKSIAEDVSATYTASAEGYAGVEALSPDMVYAKGHNDDKVKTKSGKVDNLESLNEEDLMKAIKNFEGLYYFDLLDSEGRKIYAEIFCILDSMKSDITVSTLNSDKIEKIFTYVLNDHPELFYVEGYTYTRYLVSDEPIALTFSGSYTMTESEVKAYKDYVTNYVVDFKSALNDYVENADDYNTVKFAYEYIIGNTNYDPEAPYNQSIISVMVYKNSVCSGYSKTMQYILNACGIKATVVMGTVEGGQAHSWNLIKADGDYYYMDVTWGDSSYTLKGSADEYKESLPEINYNYMLTTYDEIKKTHIFDEPESLPLCTALADNYFIREGLYFTQVDTALLANAFGNAYLRGDEYIMIKLSDATVYQDMWNYLINEQQITNYLVNSKDTISYAENKDQLYMIFWI